MILFQSKVDNKTIFFIHAKIDILWAYLDPYIAPIGAIYIISTAFHVEKKISNCVQEKPENTRLAYVKI